MKEPLDRNQAMKLVAAIRLKGSVAYSRHALAELEKDDLTTVDCVNVLRAGRITEAAEGGDGNYRYRIHTPKMCVVVAFVSETKLKIVTAWRKK